MPSNTNPNTNTNVTSSSLFRGARNMEFKGCKISMSGGELSYEGPLPIQPGQTPGARYHIDIGPDGRVSHPHAPPAYSSDWPADWDETVVIRTEPNPEDQGLTEITERKVVDSWGNRIAFWRKVRGVDEDPETKRAEKVEETHSQKTEKPEEVKDYRARVEEVEDEEAPRRRNHRATVEEVEDEEAQGRRRA